MTPTGRSPWWLVFGSIFGLAVGVGPVMQFTFSIFLKPVAEALNTDRATLSLGLTIGLVLTGLVTPIVGRLVDRFGIRRVILPLITLFALATAAVGFIPASPVLFVTLYALMGLLGAGQTPLPYAKAVSGAFDRQRGLALGVAMAGVGLGTALVPQFVQALVIHAGWRTAYVGLGALLFVLAFPSVYFFLGTVDRKTGTNAAEIADATGLTGAQAVRTPQFWAMFVAFFIVSTACAGMLAHIVAMLTDRGIARETATAAITVGGLALIAGRLLSGFLLDRLFAPSVAIVFFAAPLAGIAMLTFTTTPALALAGTVLVGLGLGAEVDLIAYLICRYMGLRAFGEIYGYLFLVFMVGAGVGPFLMGLSFDKTGSYDTTMIILMAALAIACALMLRLGPYTYGARREIGRMTMRREVAS
jgi:MFS family permease